MGATLLAFLWALGALPFPVLAQDVVTAIDPAADEISLDFQDLELAEVIKVIAEFTGRNFIYDDRVRGRVTVLSPRPVSRDEAYRVFESILQVKGFTTVKGPGGILKIIPVREAKESPIETSMPPRSVPDLDHFITRLIPLRYVKAEQMTNTLRPLVSKNANMVAYAATNTIILTDTSANIRRLLTLLDQIDVETYQEQIKVIPVEYADANTLAGQLREIFAEDSGAPARGRPRPTTRQRGAAAQQAAAATDTVVGQVGEPRFITDQRTNSIVVIAPGPTISAIVNLIPLLDYKRKGSGRIHVYRLQNADAEETAQTLTSLASGAGAPPGAGAAGAAGQAAVAGLAEGIRITADAPTNSLIVTASAEGFAALRDVIDALDVRRPQVLVESLLMEVLVDDSAALGSGLLYQSLLQDDSGARIAVGSNTGNVSGFGGLENPISDFGTIGDSATQFLAAILGRTLTVLDAEGNLIQMPVIQGIMVARGTDTDTNILSAPVVLTADNEEAQIVVGENIPIITSRVQSAAGVTAADSLATSNTVERQDVGVTLRATPQISEGDTVRLDVFIEISQVASEDPDLGPTTTKRTVENTVYVQDGETVLIGGIITEIQTEILNKVPFLGDIPILGWAFKSTSDRTRKVNLLVLLTPSIIREPTDLRQATIEQRERFRSGIGRLDFDEEEQEARRKAQQAGMDLPLDDNPVRRELERHTGEYPIEDLPELRAEHLANEAARREEIERQKATEGGEYLVQVALFHTADAAIQVLENLMAQGYDGTVLSQTIRGEVVHTVQLGPYLTEAKAHQVAREVTSSTGMETLVVVEP
jgi:general secretion pathway protein D